VTRPLAMAAVPIKPQYGPTLGRRLSPWWRAASRLTRALVLAACAAAVALVLATVLTLLNATYTHGARPRFSFSYRSLYRVRPDPGSFVKLQRHRGDGTLEDSLAVFPLTLPPYSGELSGELALYAAGYIREISRRYPDFVLRGEGKTRVNAAVNTIPAYDVVYTTRVEGQTLWGRNVLLLPPTPHARVGVEIVMLTSPSANSQVRSPLEVASAGVLQRPLKTFSFG
jgi:hypothetical protein